MSVREKNQIFKSPFLKSSNNDITELIKVNINSTGERLFFFPDARCQCSFLDVRVILFFRCHWFFVCISVLMFALMFEQFCQLTFWQIFEITDLWESHTKIIS